MYDVLPPPCYVCGHYHAGAIRRPYRRPRAYPDELPDELVCRYPEGKEEEFFHCPDCGDVKPHTLLSVGTRSGRVFACSFCGQLVTEYD